MKQILTFFIALCLLTTCASSGKTVKNSIKKVSNQELEITKAYFNFHEGNLITIIGIKSRSNCYYKQYDSILANMLYNMNISNSKTVLILLDEHIQEKFIVDGKRIFNDPNNFFQNTLFSSSTSSCNGVVVLNRSGNYLLKEGEFVKNDIVKMANKLKKE